MPEATAGRSARPKLLGLLRSIPELVSRLIRDEIAAAQEEIKEKLKTAALGAGLLIAGIVVGLFTIAAFLATAILGLTAVVPPWLAALIVAVVLLIITVILVLTGIRRVKKGVPPVPKESAASIKEDLRAMKGTRR